MTYINHPSQVVNPNSKTFHKLSTVIMIKEGDLLGGLISSPNYPLSYPNGADLTWLIVYPEGNIVKLEMEDYGTEECCDGLVVYDGFNKSRYPLATFEGDYSYGSSSNIVFSTQQAMFIRFTSDCLTTNKGFRASYINQPKSKAPIMSCGNALQTSGNEGYIQSPNYPGTYDEYMNCTWPVQTYYNTRVKFVVSNFTIGSDDNVAIYEGTTSNPGNRIANFNGNVYSGYTIYASSNEAFVAFTSGYTSYYADKFFISYVGQSNYPEATTREAYVNSTSSAYFDPPQCNGDTSSLYENGSIYSPGYFSPGHYEDFEDCIWYITVSNSYGHNAIKFEAYYFSIEYNYDYVNIYNYHSVSSSDRISQITGYVYPYTTLAVSSSTTATLRFTSDSSVTHTGFDIKFTGVISSTFNTEAPAPITTPSYSANNTCPGPSYVSGYSGFVQSPNYPNNYYNNMNCTQWVNTPYRTTVQLMVENFNLNSYDYVYIYDGYTGNYLRSFSGYYSYGYTWQAPTNYIRMHFISDSYYSSSGYSFHYEGISESSYYTTVSPETCGGQVPFNNGSITSPNYPAYYTNSLDCVWSVTVTSNMYVLFTIEYFDTEGCCDYVSFYKGNRDNSSSQVDSLRGYVSQGYEILIRDNKAWVSFHTDGSVTDQGFYITYQPVTTNYIPSYNATTDGYDVVTPGNNGATQWVRSGIEAENAPKTLGKDLWGNKQRPAHLRKEKIKREDQREDTLN